MGIETAAAIGLALSAAGAGATAYNAHQTAKQQDEVAAQGIRQQASRQRDLDSRVNQEVKNVQASNPDAERQKSTADFLAALRRRPDVAGGIGGATSGRYAEDSADAGGEVEDFGRRAADSLARIQSPLQQRQNETQGFSRLATDIGSVARNASGDQFLNQLRQRSIAGNPLVEGLGQLATGAGSALATRQPGPRYRQLTPAETGSIFAPR